MRLNIWLYAHKKVALPLTSDLALIIIINRKCVFDHYEISKSIFINFNKLSNPPWNKEKYAYATIAINLLK